MPPKSLPSRKKNGQFTSQVGQPPSSLATPSTPHLPSRKTPSRSVFPASRTTSPVRTTRAHLSSLIDPSDLDDALMFGATCRSRSTSPTTPAPNQLRSASPVTSDFPTSLESNQTDGNQDQAPTDRFVIPAGFDTSLQFLPALVSRARITQSPSRPLPSSFPNLPLRPVPNHTKTHFCLCSPR